MPDARIMIVEDNSAEAMGIQKCVENMGHSVVSQVASGEQAIRDLESIHPDVICMAAMLYDIGMVNMADETFRKEGVFTDKEMELMRTHSQLGHDMLCELELPDRIPEIVLQHHERIDGSGYPARLSGNNILLEARIIAVAEAIEAMTSARSY